MNTTTTKIAGEAMTDEQIVDLAKQVTGWTTHFAVPQEPHGHFYAGHHHQASVESILRFARALLESKPTVQPMPGAHLWMPADIPAPTQAPADFGDRSAYAFKRPSASQHDPWYVVLPNTAALKLGYHADDEIDRQHAEFIAAAINRAIHPTAPAQSCGDAEQADEAVTRDAERYRRMRDFNVRCKDGVDVKPPCEHVFASIYSHAVGTIPATRLVTGDELDRAIDADRAKDSK